METESLRGVVQEAQGCACVLGLPGGGLWGIRQGSALQLQVWGSFAQLPTPAMWGGNGGRGGASKWPTE